MEKNDNLKYLIKCETETKFDEAEAARIKQSCDEAFRQDRRKIIKALKYLAKH